MRTIRISDKVWSAIAERGKFGETADDVLKRILDLPRETISEAHPLAGRRGRGNRRYATKRMACKVDDGKLVVEFEDGVHRDWNLSDRRDKAALRRVREDATQFAIDNGATDPGQTNAVRKALTDAGYHLHR